MLSVSRAHRFRFSLGGAVLSAAHWLGALCLLAAALAVLGGGLQLIFVALGGHPASGHDAGHTLAAVGIVMGLALFGDLVLARALRYVGVRLLPAEHGVVVDESEPTLGRRMLRKYAGDGHALPPG